MRMQYWTQEKTEQLLKHWAEGLSASAIADKIGGVSRNAVIGKVNRMGLAARRKAHHRQRPSPRTEDMPERHCFTSMRSGTYRLEMVLFDLEPRKPHAWSQKRIDATPLPPPEVTEVTDVAVVSHNDLQNDTCRWVCATDTPNNDAPKYCGCKQMLGKPYCENHARRAYQVPGMGQKQIANPRQPQRQMAIQGSVVADLRTLEEAV